MSITVEGTDVSLTVATPAQFTLAVSPGQGPAGRPPVVNITDMTYDGSDRVTGYKLNNVEHVVTYPDSVTVVDTGGGQIRTTTLDGLGRIISAIIS